MAIKEVILGAINNPKLLIGAGIAGFVGAAAWACVQTLKLEGIIDDANEQIDDITESHSEDELQLPEVKKEYAIVRAKMAGKIALNYAGPVILAGMAGYAICRAYGLQREAYLAMSAAYGTMAKAYDAVLDRVEKKWGPEGLKYAKYGIEQQEVEKEITDEKGKKKKVKETEDVCNERWEDIRKSRPFAIVFDEETELYRQNGGSIVSMRSDLVGLEGNLQRRYNQGAALFYNADVVRLVAGDDTRWISDLGQISGWYDKDKANVEATGGSPVLNIETFNGTDPDTGDRRQYIMIDPNCALVDLDKTRDLHPIGSLQLQKKRVGNRYSGLVSG